MSWIPHLPVLNMNSEIDYYNEFTNKNFAVTLLSIKSEYPLKND
jgi:hypothetical protein